ncbi:MAG: hypothetical protein ACTSU9_14605, partial [Promethearchaeota archaeon]
MDFWHIFNTGFTWVTAILIIVFGVFFVLGYNMIFKEIKLIKEKNVSKVDRVLSVLFGIIFSMTATLGISIGIQYGSAALFNAGLVSGAVTSPTITIGIFLVLYGFLMVFPLLEFTFLALGHKDSSIFAYQDLLKRNVTGKIKNKMGRLGVAFALYFLIFLVVPIILQATIGLSFLISSLTIAQAFPVFTLSQLGSGGFFWGINLHYYNILEKDRLIYTLFDDRKKFGKRFDQNMIPIIAVPTMIFVYVNSFLSLRQMIILLSDAITNNVTPKNIGFTFLFSTIINILMVLIGYYNKYWKKQVKYKFTEIMLAGYLFAALGMNIFLNFYVKTPAVLENVFFLAFNETSQAAVYQWLHPSFMIPVAMIQKTVFVIFVSYYFLGKSDYKKNVIESIMMLARNRLNPKPLINLLRHKDPELREEARELLREIYKRHGMKRVLSVDERKKQEKKEAKKKGKEKKPSIISKLFGSMKAKKIKQAPFEPVFDSIGSDHEEIRRVMKVLLDIMVEEDPEQVIELINVNLATDNSIKLSLLLPVLGQVEQQHKHLVNLDETLNAIISGDIHSKSAGMEILPVYEDLLLQNDDLTSKLVTLIQSGINHPSMRVQSSTLKLLGSIDISVFNDQIDSSILYQKLEHPNQDIKRHAIQACNKLQSPDGQILNEKQILEFLEHKNPKLQNSAILSLLSGDSNITEEIPPEKILDLLQSKDKELSLNTIKLVAKLSLQDAEKYPNNLIFKALQEMDPGDASEILPEIEDLVLTNPEPAMPVLMNIMQQGDIEIKERGKKLLVGIGSENFTLVLENLLKIEIDARFS